MKLILPNQLRVTWKDSLYVRTIHSIQVDDQEPGASSFSHSAKLRKTEHEKAAIYLNPIRNRSLPTFTLVSTPKSTRTFTRRRVLVLVLVGNDSGQ